MRKVIIATNKNDYRCGYVMNVLPSEKVGKKPREITIDRYKNTATTNRRHFSAILPYFKQYENWSFKLVDF